MIGAFEDPRWLLIAVVIVPVVLLGMRLLKERDALRRRISLGLRAVLLLVLAVALAVPLLRRTHERLTVVVLMDISESVRAYGSVPDSIGRPEADPLPAIRRWLMDATESRRPDDLFGMVLFAGDAMVVRAPSVRGNPDVPMDAALAPGTNIAEAIRLGLAILPTDTAKRLILVSDGNETAGDARAAARSALDEAAATSVPIPIDVLPIPFREIRDVRMVRVDAPSSGRPGQRVRLRVILESTHPTSGRLSVRQEGQPVDLDPTSPDTSRAVQLRAGTNVEVVDIELDARPINRFEAIFEPDDPQDDLVRTNNRSTAFTVTPSGGSIMIVRQDGRGGRLERLLTAAELPVSVISPDEVPETLLDLQNADLIVLENVAASRFNEAQMSAMAAHVTDLGGGLLMTGGLEGFGAGAWQNTPIGEILPLELDPPRELRAPQAALVFVMDISGSMNFPVAGARASQLDLAITATNRAIDALQDDTMVGVVTFNTQSAVALPLQRIESREAIRNRVEAITAGGGTHIGSGLRRGIEVLRHAETEQRVMILLSDGVSMPDDYDEILAIMRDRGIRLTTIAIGDQTDLPLLRRLAEEGNGEFLTAINPRILPRVLVDSVRIVNRPLIREGSFSPLRTASGSRLTDGFIDVPALGGLVITAPLEDPLATIDLVHPDGEPLLATRQRGMGRVGAFTGELDGPWLAQWANWSRGEALIVDLARSLMRAGSAGDLEAIVRARGGALSVTLLADDPSDGLLDGLEVTGTVYAPSGRTAPIRLTEIVPGRFTAEHEVSEVGPHIVALTPRRIGEALPPVLGGAVIEDSMELAQTEPDHALLEDIAALTGGRVLRLDARDTAAIFEREGLPIFSSLTALRAPLLILLITLLLLDIASRRIAYRSADVREAGRRMLQPVQRGRGLAVGKAVGRIRDRRVQSPNDRLTDHAPIAERAYVARKEVMTDSDRAETLTESASADPPPASDPLSNASAPRSADAPPDSDAPAAPGSDMRSSLRAARARARQRTDQRDSKPPSDQ